VSACGLGSCHVCGMFLGKFFPFPLPLLLCVDGRFDMVPTARRIRGPR
jgi:hypothetical protein